MRIIFSGLGAASNWKIMLGRLILFGVAAAPPYAILRAMWCKYRKQDQKTGALREIFLALFVMFAAGLAVLIFWPGTFVTSGGVVDRIQKMRAINLHPFASIRSYLRYRNSEQLLVNIIGNFALFIPIGFFPPLLWFRYWKFRRILAYGCALPAAIELIQLFNGRVVDIDDIILNVAGVFIGFGMCRIAARLFPGIIKRLA